MLYDKYAKEYPTKRLFSLNRSGFAGTQRYGIFPWTGDVSRSWNGLQAQLPILLGMTMSGVPYVHSDAGGFAGGEKEPELYVRWLQFAQFTPIFRPHGTELSKVDTAAPSYPSEPALFDEPYRSIAKNVVVNRYKMLPYNYTLAYQQATEGKPLMSPLYYYFRSDTSAAKIEDQYMWGENVLVAPVLEKGATTRKVYLPAGKWFDFKTLSQFDGGKWIDKLVDLGLIPVFIKEGSFIPQHKNAAPNTSSLDKASLSLLYTPSSNPSTFIMYDDDGESKDAIEKKKYELITFSSTGMHRNKVILSITSDKGMFKGKPSKRNVLLSIPGVNKPATIKVDGQIVKLIEAEPTLGALWLKDYKTLSVPLVVTQKPLKVEISW
jgi:oligosaccharide 4-alpha-D-glucosyltransferase